MASTKRTEVKKRIGGRGCPACGSHNTEGLGPAGAQWCITCHHRWIPCSPGCRGYQLDVDHADGPQIVGCRGCGVPDKLARMWPETYRAMMYRLGGSKLERLVD